MKYFPQWMRWLHLPCKLQRGRQFRAKPKPKRKYLNRGRPKKRQILRNRPVIKHEPECPETFSNESSEADNHFGANDAIAPGRASVNINDTSAVRTMLRNKIPRLILHRIDFKPENHTKNYLKNEELLAPVRNKILRVTLCRIDDALCINETELKTCYYCIHIWNKNIFIVLPSTFNIFTFTIITSTK